MVRLGLIQASALDPDPNSIRDLVQVLALDLGPTQVSALDLGFRLALRLALILALILALLDPNRTRDRALVLALALALAQVLAQAQALDLRLALNPIRDLTLALALVLNLDRTSLPEVVPRSNLVPPWPGPHG